MINFPCKCGFRFSLPADQAGGLIQCPACHLLVDVPTLNDLKHLNSDGTIEFENPEPLADEVTAADLHGVFTRRTVDGHGMVKDLRPGPGHFEVIGLEDEINPRPAPRYDPVTGELIRPLQLKDETPVPVISMGVEVDPSEAIDEEDPDAPMAVLPIGSGKRPRSLGYAVGETRKKVTLANLGFELLMPANIAVMFFILPVYVIGYYITREMFFYATGYLEMKTLWPFLIGNFAIWMVVSHMACVIEDTGPEAIDELPRPLRNFSAGEDVIAPLLRTLLAGAICFLPMILAIRSLHWHNPVVPGFVMLLAFGGTFFFPAVLLTTVTGTTLANLRPDRVLAVIRCCGMEYLASIILLVLAGVPSIYYLASALLFPPDAFNEVFFRIIEAPVFMVPLMMMSIYLLHYFAWHLGLMYRDYQDEFPWLLQRHVKEDPGGPRRAMNG